MPANSVNASDNDFTTSSGELIRAERTFLHPGFTENLAFSYVGGTGTFSVTGANGSSLSATNPGYVTLQSKATPGLLTRHTITADQSFIDDAGASEIVGNLFGYNTGVAITVDIPFFVYAVTNDDEDAIQFMISRVPHYTTSPVSTEIGTPASAIADEQISFFSFDSVTVTEYDQNPCRSIGSFRMRMSASDDWTVQTLSIEDGVGNFNEDTAFTLPLGQFGANSGTYTIANGGTAAVFSSVSGTYWIKRNGVCNFQLFQNGDGGTDGTGVVEAQCTIPYRPKGRPIAAALQKVAGGNLLSGLVVFGGSTVSYHSMYLGDTGAGNAIFWNQFSAGDRFWRVDTTYFIN